MMTMQKETGMVVFFWLLLFLCIRMQKVNADLPQPGCQDNDDCIKRGSRQVDAGPFWANRGKRDPATRNDQLFADEPGWTWGRREPGFGSSSEGGEMWRIIARNYPEYLPRRFSLGMPPSSPRDRRDPAMTGDDLPFFAARGKKRHPMVDAAQGRLISRILHERDE